MLLKSLRIIAPFLMTITQPLLAVDLMQFTNSLETKGDETARLSIVGIIESCGNASNIDDSCAIAGLERLSTEENNTYAKALLADYEKALNLGNYSSPECQQDSHMQANRIVAHCLLLLNYYAVKDQDKDLAIMQYETCLQGGMQGLVYQGNIVAQYMLGQLFSLKGIPETAQVWQNAINFRKEKDVDEYNALVKCYK